MNRLLLALLSAGAFALSGRGHGRLVNATEKNDTESVRRLIAAGIDGDPRQKDTALMVAKPNVQRVARKLYNNEQTPQYAPGR